MNDSIKSSTSTLEKGDTAPHVSDNSQLSVIKNNFILLTPLQQRQFIEVLDRMKDKRKDVYYLVCLNNHLLYQGYSISEALDSNSLVMAELKKDTNTPCEFIGVYPDGSLFDFGYVEGVE